MLKWAGIAIFAVIAIPLALLLLINLRDEALSPQAAAFMQGEQPSVPDEQNGFYYLVGFDAPLAEDPHKAGKAWLTAVNATQDRRLTGADATWPRQPQGLPKIASVCSPDRDSCIRWLKEKAGARKLLEDHAQIVGRYRGVHAYPGFFEATDARLFSYPLPSLVPPANAQRLYLLDIARRLERGEVDAALAALRDEIALARRMMAGSRSLLQKMLGTAQLVRATLFASDALTVYRVKIGRRAAMLDEVLRPLSAQERRLAPALRREFAMSVSGADPARWRAEDFGIGLDTALVRPFYQHHASMNLLHEFFRAWSEVDSAPAAELDAAFARAKAAEPQFSIWHATYNPVGKVLLFSSAPMPSGYFDRLWDTDVLVRMVALQAQAVALGVKADAVADFLQRSSNPYTGKPFAWDAGTRQVHFTPRSNYLKERKIGGAANRVAVPL